MSDIAPDPAPTDPPVDPAPTPAPAPDPIPVAAEEPADVTPAIALPDVRAAADVEAGQ